MAVCKTLTCTAGPNAAYDPAAQAQVVVHSNTAALQSSINWLASAESHLMCGADGPNQVQVSRELLALRVLNREPLGMEDSSESSPLALWEVRGSLGEAEGGTTESQLEDGGMRRQGVHPGGEEPAAMRPLLMPSRAGPLAAKAQLYRWWMHQDDSETGS